MTFFPRRFVAAAVLAALALPALAESAAAPAASATAAPVAAAPAAAASAPQGRPGPGARMHGHRHPHSHGYQQGYAAPEQRQANMAQHAADLKAQLKIAPEQEGAWTTFTAAMAPSQGYARLSMDGMEKLTVPERIDRMHAIHVQRSAEMERRGEAVKAFYAALTPAQQKTFDAHHSSHHSAMHRARAQDSGTGQPNGRGPGAMTEPGHEYCHPDGEPSKPGMGAGPRHGGHNMRPMRPAAMPAAAPAAPAPAAAASAAPAAAPAK